MTPFFCSPHYLHNNTNKATPLNCDGSSSLPPFHVEKRRQSTGPFLFITEKSEYIEIREPFKKIRMTNSKEMKIATSSNNKNSFTIISDNNDENKENIPPSTILLLKSLTLDCKNDDDRNKDASDGVTTLLPSKIDDTTAGDNNADTANDERSCSGQTDRLDNNQEKEESIVVKDDMKENNVALTKATLQQAVLPKTAYLPNLPTLKLPKTETTTATAAAARRKVITLTVSPGRLGLSLKLNKSTTTTTTTTGAIIVDIHPACAFIDKIDIGDCIILIDGNEVKNLDDFKANCDEVRVFDVVKGMNNSNNKKMMKERKKTTTCNIVTKDKVLKNGDEKRGGVDAMISNNGVLSTISNIYKRR